MSCSETWIERETGIQWTRGPDGMTRAGDPVDAIPPHVMTRDPDHVWGVLRLRGGGDCPVDRDTVVRCLFRDRRPYIGTAIWSGMSDEAAASMWMHAPSPGRPDPAFDIIAYQLEVGK